MIGHCVYIEKHDTPSIFVNKHSLHLPDRIINCSLSSRTSRGVVTKWCFIHKIQFSYVVSNNGLRQGFPLKPKPQNLFEIKPMENIITAT